MTLTKSQQEEIEQIVKASKLGVNGWKLLMMLAGAMGVSGVGSYAVAPVVTDTKLAGAIKQGVTLELARDGGLVERVIKVEQVQVAAADAAQQATEAREKTNEELHNIDLRIERLDERQEQYQKTNERARENQDRKLDAILDKLENGR